MLRNLALAPVAGVILNAAWLGHITASDEFYDSVKNSKFGRYWGMTLGSMIYYFIYAATYAVAEYKHIFSNA